MRSGVSTRASRRSALRVVSMERSGSLMTVAGGFLGGRALASASAGFGDVLEYQVAARE